MGLRTTAIYDSLATMDAQNEYIQFLWAKDFRHIDFTVIASSVTSWFTLTVYGSDQQARPDISASVSATNSYAVLQVVDKNTWDPIDGSTWIVITGNWQTRYEINDNLSTWIGIKMTARTDWTANVIVSMADNS